MSITTDARSLQTGELAKLAGVSPDTIRHYERIGILPRAERTQSGYRRFSPQAVNRVRLIRNSLGIGFSLRELARVLHVKDAGGAPCDTVHSLARQKLEALREQIAELQRRRAEMEAILRDWNRRIAQTPRGRRAGLLDSLRASRIQPTSRRNLK